MIPSHSDEWTKDRARAKWVDAVLVVAGGLTLWAAYGVYQWVWR